MTKVTFLSSVAKELPRFMGSKHTMYDYDIIPNFKDFKTITVNRVSHMQIQELVKVHDLTPNFVLHASDCNIFLGTRDFYYICEKSLSEWQIHNPVNVSEDLVFIESFLASE